MVPREKNGDTILEDARALLASVHYLTSMRIHDDWNQK